MTDQLDEILEKARATRDRLVQMNRELRRGWSVFDLPPHGQEHVADILPFKRPEEK